MGETLLPVVSTPPPAQPPQPLQPPQPPHPGPASDTCGLLAAAGGVLADPTLLVLGHYLALLCEWFVLLSVSLRESVSMLF